MVIILLCQIHFHPNSALILQDIMMRFSGRPCGSTPTMPNWRDEMDAAEERNRQMGRNGLECESEGYTSGSGNTGGSISAADILLDLVFVFIVFGFAIGIWCACVQRQKAINAANLNNFSG